MNIAVIQARSTSTRLPGKVLMDICGRTILEHVVHAAQGIEGLDAVVVATPRDEPQIAALCRKIGAPCISPRVPDNNVLARFTSVLQQFPADYVLRVCADSPMLDAPACETLLLHATAGADYVGYRIGGTPIVGKPTGMFGEVVSAKALVRLDGDLAPDDVRREHVTLGIYQQPDNYACRWLVPKRYRGELYAVDTMEDYKRVKAMMEQECLT